jgi:hypothetical protein
MSETHNAERRWALTWQRSLERQSPPLVEELHTLIRTLPGIRPDVAAHVLDLLSWVPPNRAVVILSLHNGCGERAAAVVAPGCDALDCQPGDIFVYEPPER